MKVIYSTPEGKIFATETIEVVQLILADNKLYGVTAIGEVVDLNNRGNLIITDGTIQILA